MLKLNLANRITMTRIFLVPFFVVAAFLDIPYANLIAAAIFIIAASTDGLDGYIARKRKQITKFGKFLDPLADKLLVTAALIALVGQEKVPAWVATVIISREFIVTGVRLIAAGEGKVIAASWWGKLKTVTQIVAIVLLLINTYKVKTVGEIFSSITTNVTTDFVIFILANVTLALAVIITIYSCIDYLVANKDVISQD